MTRLAGVARASHDDEPFPPLTAARARERAPDPTPAQAFHESRITMADVTEHAQESSGLVVCGGYFKRRLDRRVEVSAT